MIEAEPMINYMLSLSKAELKEYKVAAEKWVTNTETYRVARSYLLEAIEKREALNV